MVRCTRLLRGNRIVTPVRGLDVRAADSWDLSPRLLISGSLRFRLEPSPPGANAPPGLPQPEVQRSGYAERAVNDTAPSFRHTGLADASTRSNHCLGHRRLHGGPLTQKHSCDGSPTVWRPLSSRSQEDKRQVDKGSGCLVEPDPVYAVVVRGGQACWLSIWPTGRLSAMRSRSVVCTWQPWVSGRRSCLV